jgi:predicted ATP-grasp superfamily ATP-dependent carboligase
MGVPVVIIHYRTRDTAHFSGKIRSSLRAPDPECAEEEFVDMLIREADRFEHGVLIPVADEAIVAVARHREKLQRHYHVACSPWNVARLFIDKKHTYELAEEHGIAAPKTILIRSLEDLETKGRSLGFPCLVKPSQSHLFYSRFRRKLALAETFDQLVREYLRATEVGLEVLLQEIIPGNDSQVANYCSYSWDGQALVEFTSQQIRKGPVSYGPPRIVCSRRVPEVIEPGRKILAAMGFQGYSCIEFKKDKRDGIYKLLEVNGRHNLSTLLAERCGINFPWLEYHHQISGQKPESTDFQTDIYWIDLIRDLGYAFTSLAGR